MPEVVNQTLFNRLFNRGRHIDIRFGFSYRGSKECDLLPNPSCRRSFGVALVPPPMGFVPIIERGAAMTRSTVDRISSADVTARIFQLVLSLQPEERRTLLRDLESRVSHGDRRRTRRSGAYISVDLESPNAYCQGLIRNVSAGGVFIRTEDALDVGADVLMTFMVPGSRRRVRAIGTVIRVSRDGAGIRFESGLKPVDRLDPA